MNFLPVAGVVPIVDSIQLLAGMFGRWRAGKPYSLGM